MRHTGKGEKDLCCTSPQQSSTFTFLHSQHRQTAYVWTKQQLTVDANASNTFTAEQVQELRRPNYSRDPQRKQTNSEQTRQKLGKSIIYFFAAVKPRAKKRKRNAVFFPLTTRLEFLWVIMWSCSTAIRTPDPLKIWKRVFTRSLLNVNQPTEHWTDSQNPDLREEENKKNEVNSFIRSFSVPVK